MHNLARSLVGRQALIAILLTILSADLGRTARGSEHLRSELGGMAGQLARSIKELGKTSISIDRLQGPPNLPTSSGPGIAQILADAFRKEGIEVDPKADLALKGEYLITEVQPDAGEPSLLAMRIKGTVEDRDGNALPGLEFDRKIRDETAFVEVMAMPVTLDPAGTDQERNRQILECLIEPEAVVEGNRVLDANRDYGIEVVVDGLPREIREQGAPELPYVSIDRGERYHVRLINNTDHEAAARLLIDGLSLYEFSYERNASGPSQGEPKYNYVIMPARSTLEIKGWHRTNEESDEFEVTEYAKGAIAEVADHLRDDEKLGTINALFMAAWPEGEAPPSDELTEKEGPNVTGFGPRIEAKYTVISKRTIGRLRSSVSIRYSR